MTVKIDGIDKTFPLRLKDLESPFWISDRRVIQRHAILNKIPLTHVPGQSQKDKGGWAFINESDLIKTLKSMQRAAQREKMSRRTHAWLRDANLDADEVVVESPGGRIEITLPKHERK